MKTKFKIFVIFDFINFERKFFLKVFDDTRRLILFKIKIFIKAQKRRERYWRNICASSWSERVVKRNAILKIYKKKSFNRRTKKEHQSISRSNYYCHSFVDSSIFLTTAIYLFLLTLVIFCQVIFTLLLDLFVIVFLRLYQNSFLMKISATNSFNQRFIFDVLILMTFLSFIQFDANTANMQASRENTVSTKQIASKNATKIVQTFLIFAFVFINRYMIFILFLEYYNALYFDDYNVTKFLKRFNEQYYKHYVKTKNKFKKLLRNCKKFIDNFVNILIF